MRPFNAGITPQFRAYAPDYYTCPVCGQVGIGHRLGTGCRWCDHVTCCDACRAHDDYLDSVRGRGKKPSHPPLDCVQQAWDRRVKR